MDIFNKRNIRYKFYNKNNNLIADLKENYPNTININFDGLPSLNKAEIKIYNLKPSLMNLITFLKYKSLELPHLVIECIVDNQIVFKGDIIESIPVYDIPNPYIKISAMTDIHYLVEPSKDILYDIPNGKDFIEKKIKDVIDDIFYDTNKSISYYNVDSVVITNPRYLGSKIEQLEKIKNEANINIVLNHDNVIVAPKILRNPIGDIINIKGNDKRIVKQISNDKEGIVFTTIFNNNLTLLKTVRIFNNKLNENANGNFIIYYVEHSLSSNIPEGEFFTRVKARFARTIDL